MTKVMSRNEAVIKARMYKDSSSVHLTDAYLCIDCETIYSGSSCPCCASGASIRLREILKT